MVILKKIYSVKLKASSLTEVLVATVIILLIFGIAVLTIDNLLFNTVKSSSHTIDNELSEIVYQYKNGTITLPYYSDENEWVINSEEVSDGKNNIIVFEAENKTTKKKVSKKIVAHGNKKN